MVALSISFLTGQYHANPWGRNVNEGVAEWPPSPYRLLRAIYDVWKRKCPEIDQGIVESLFIKLASIPPEYGLPHSTTSHIRYWMNENTKNPSDRKMIFDAFAIVNPETSIVVRWKGICLNNVERAALESLLRNTNYLGRSESWVSMTLTNEEGLTCNCSPLEGFDGPIDRTRVVRVACVTSKDNYVPYNPSKGNKDMAWLDAITYGTSEMIRDGANFPPLLQYHNYLLPEEQRISRNDSTRPIVGRVVQGVKYKLECEFLPSITKALDVSNQVHVRLMGINKRMNGPENISCHFSGKDADGSLLQGHRHVYILPRDEDGDGRIDHLLVLCNEALNNSEMVTLDRMASLYQSDGLPDIRLIPICWGNRDELQEAEESKIYRSSTPFIPPRFYRKGRDDFPSWLESEVRRECRDLGLPEPVRVAPMPSLKTKDRDVSWSQFRRSRKNEKPRYGMGFEIEFDKPIRGPVVLGYGSHFGLGQFIPYHSNHKAE